MAERVAPLGAIRERLGIRPAGPVVVTRKVTLDRLRVGDQVWLRRDQVINLLRVEAEATGDSILGQLARALEEGT